MQRFVFFTEETIFDDTLTPKRFDDIKWRLLPWGNYSFSFSNSNKHPRNISWQWQTLKCVQPFSKKTSRNIIEQQLQIIQYKFLFRFQRIRTFPNAERLRSIKRKFWSLLMMQLSLPMSNYSFISTSSRLR